MKVRDGFRGLVSMAALVLAIAAQAATPVPRSFFGMTVLNFMNDMPEIPFGTIRTWDAYPGLNWSDENPAPDQYNFSGLDRFLAVYAKSNAEVLYTFGRTPRWASSQPDALGPYGPGECAPPARMADWEKFVRALATHVAGKIHYWELWNEPDGGKDFYCGDMPTMVRMAARAAAILKSIDPEAKLLSPGVTGAPGPTWLGQFLSAGGGKAVDIIAFHGYWSATAEDINQLVERYRSVLAANGMSAKLLWDTEASWAAFGQGSLKDPALRAAFTAKYYVLQWSDGVSRVIWYAYDGGEKWGGLWDHGGLHADGAAYREVYRWLVGATAIDPCATDVDETWTCKYRSADGDRSQVVWNSRRALNYRVPAGFTRSRDLSGKIATTGGTVSVGTAPILLEAAP